MTAQVLNENGNGSIHQSRLTQALLQAIAAAKVAQEQGFHLDGDSVVRMAISVFIASGNGYSKEPAEVPAAKPEKQAEAPEKKNPEQRPTEKQLNVLRKYGKDLPADLTNITKSEASLLIGRLMIRH